MCKGYRSGEGWASAFLNRAGDRSFANTHLLIIYKRLVPWRSCCFSVLLCLPPRAQKAETHDRHTLLTALITENNVPE